MLFKAHTVAKRALEDEEALRVIRSWKRMRCTTLPAIIELSGLVDRPLQEDGKLPLLPEDMAEITTSVFPYDDSCLEADAKILFRIGSHRTRIASESPRAPHPIMAQNSRSCSFGTLTSEEFWNF